MIWRFDNLGHDSVLRSPNLCSESNEPKTFPSGCGKRQRPVCLGTKDFVQPDGDSFSANHSRLVSSRSGSGKPLNRECRALARATSGSLTTRIPQASDWRSVGDGQRFAGKNRTRIVPLVPKGMLARCLLSTATFQNAKAEMPPPVRSQGRVGARAVSNDRTYRRSETEQKLKELRENRGERSSQTLACSARVKAAVWNLGKTDSKQREVQTELVLSSKKRICSKCKINPVYLDIETQDYCEPCIYESVQN